MTASIVNSEQTSQSAVRNAPYSVRLPVFEGPLDLLLHLIRLNEVEITDIPIARISEQYLEHLTLIDELDLEVAGEYLVMASTLAWIKSRMLLPAERVGDDGEEIDPRAELVARLLEYQRFKEAAQGIQEMISVNQDYLPRLCPSPATGQKSRLKPSDQIEIWNTFNAVLRRIADQLVGEGVIHDEHVTGTGCMEKIIDKLKREREFLFSTLFTKRDSLVHLVASFLAILELSRLKQLTLEQDSHFTDIRIAAGALLAGATIAKKQSDTEAS